ncbi:ABC transporter ATP-binding protein [uncultured Devosia sp.]|uniref:ABC transporter ATP-binding protein n=1 Tax=uncultured Devosia sp. TaxID=211434 RepID=UPI00263A2846|nr:ABC transporter ATP-binding protein [uncultured Devosia sp.]
MGDTNGDGPAHNGGRSISLRRVSKVFLPAANARVKAIDDVSLLVPACQFVAIVGPSGCGKSTLLRLVDGLIMPDSGAVTIGNSGPAPGPGIGMMFQTVRLIPWRTVRDNVGFALEGGPLDRAERKARIETQLLQVGLGRWADHYPAQLSGGMQQRVALARALVGRPDVLLMDEPFASLDAQTRELMQEDLLALWSNHRPTVLFVTHSVDEALLLADRVIVMGRGKVLEDFLVHLPRPRTTADARQARTYGQLRDRLWSRIRALVLADPESAFFGRGGAQEPKRPQ